MTYSSQRIVPRAQRRAQLGFTLTELMAVVVITSVLAVVGTAMFRQHILASRSAETTSMIRSIAAAQERYRGENMLYLDVSAGNLTSYYPSANVGDTKFAWAQNNHQDLARWQLLNPTVTGPVQFGYATVAGPPGPNPPLPQGLQVAPLWPNNFQTPWYVIQAMGDPDGDGRMGYFVSFSFNSQIVQAGDVP